MNLTPREFDKLLIYMLADVAAQAEGEGHEAQPPRGGRRHLRRRPGGAREGKTVEDVMTEARQALTGDDVMEGVVEMIPFVQLEAVFTDGSRLITVHAPIA